jgi:aminotransferase
MLGRTVTISGLSKTFSITGWRLGYCVAPAEVTNGIRKVHDFLTVGAAAPLQEAGTIAMGLPSSYYETLQREYVERRDLMVEILEGIGVEVYRPSGAYYVMTDIAALGFEDDAVAARRLTAEIGVASVPGSSFYSRPDLGRTKLRFSFCKRLETLRAAGERLARIRDLAART